MKEDEEEVGVVEGRLNHEGHEGGLLSTDLENGLNGLGERIRGRERGSRKGGKRGGRGVAER
jgi:hypothetical protein